MTGLLPAHLDWVLCKQCASVLLSTVAMMRIVTSSCIYKCQCTVNNPALFPEAIQLWLQLDYIIHPEVSEVVAI